MKCAVVLRLFYQNFKRMNCVSVLILHSMVHCVGTEFVKPTEISDSNFWQFVR